MTERTNINLNIHKLNNQIMTLQKVVITDDEFKINSLIKEGWDLKSVTAQHVAITGGTSFTSKLEGKFCFVLEKFESK